MQGRPTRRRCDHRPCGASSRPSLPGSPSARPRSCALRRAKFARRAASDARRGRRPCPPFSRRPWANSPFCGRGLQGAEADLRLVAVPDPAEAVYTLTLDAANRRRPPIKDAQCLHTGIPALRSPPLRRCAAPITIAFSRARWIACTSSALPGVRRYRAHLRPLSHRAVAPHRWICQRDHRLVAPNDYLAWASTLRWWAPWSETAGRCGVGAGWHPQHRGQQLSVGRS